MLPRSLWSAGLGEGKGKKKKKARRLFQYGNSIKFMRAWKEYFSVFRENDFCLGHMGLSHMCCFFTPDLVGT